MLGVAEAQVILLTVLSVLSGTANLLLSGIKSRLKELDADILDLRTELQDHTNSQHNHTIKEG